MWSTGQTSVCTGGSRNSRASSCWLMEGGSNLCAYAHLSATLLIAPRFWCLYYLLLFSYYFNKSFTVLQRLNQFYKDRRLVLRNMNNVFFWWRLWLQDLWWFRSAALLAVSPSRCGLVCRGKSEESELGNRHHDGGYGHGNKMSEVNAKTLNGIFPYRWGGGLAVPTKSATFFLNKNRLLALKVLLEDLWPVIAIPPIRLTIALNELNRPKVDLSRPSIN